MTRYTPEDCHDLSEAGSYRAELEIDQSGEITLTCPCCEGSGEHTDRPGNDPDALDYSCRTCDGRGVIAPRLSTVIPAWKGASLGGKLSITPSRQEEKTWHIHGPSPAERATGSTRTVVQLAHTVLVHLEKVGEISRLEWIKQYRRLSPSVTYEGATEAYLKQFPEARGARSAA